MSIKCHQNAPKSSKIKSLKRLKIANERSQTKQNVLRGNSLYSLCSGSQDGLQPLSAVRLVPREFLQSGWCHADFCNQGGIVPRHFLQSVRYHAYSPAPPFSQGGIMPISAVRVVLRHFLRSGWYHAIFCSQGGTTPFSAVRVVPRHFLQSG